MRVNLFFKPQKFTIMKTEEVLKKLEVTKCRYAGDTREGYDFPGSQLTFKIWMYLTTAMKVLEDERPRDRMCIVRLCDYISQLIESEEVVYNEHAQSLIRDLQFARSAFTDYLLKS